MATINVQIDNKNEFGYDSSILSDEPVYENDELNEEFIGDLFNYVSEQLSDELTIDDIPHEESVYTFDVTPQTLNEKINGDELEPLIKSFEDSLYTYEHNNDIKGTTYRLVDTSKIKEFLDNNPIDKRQWIKDEYVCLHFSSDLYHAVKFWDSSLAFGKCSGGTDAGGHGWNFFIDENKKLKYIEPQSDTIFNPDETLDNGLGKYDIRSFKI